jgi:hypothetical protein
MTRAIKRLAHYGHHLPLRWTTVALIAAALAYIDGFWLTALQGAIGAIERNQPPFTRWLRDSTLMLPLVFLAVLLALLLARRWFAGSRSKLVGLGAAALLIALLSGGVGLAEAGASSLTDYQYQIQHLHLASPNGTANQADKAELAGFGTPAPLPYSLYCNLRGVAAGSATSLIEYATLMVHVRALTISAVVLLLVNLGITALLLALLRNRLWAPQSAVVQQASGPPGQIATGGISA